MSMNRINPNRLLTAEAVFFKDDRAPITDCVLFILDKFVIIGTDPDDSAPVWYNIDLIDRLAGINYWTAPVQTKAQTKAEHWNSLW